MTTLGKNRLTYLPAIFTAESESFCNLFQVDRAKVLSNTIKQKRKQKAGKWEVPLPKVCSAADIAL